MSLSSVIAFVTKGIDIAKSVWEDRDLAKQAIDSVKKILDRGKDVTPEEIEKTEAELDALLAEFNADLPPP